jgi:hypothetical protein
MRNDNELGGDCPEPDDEALDIAARSAVAHALWVKKRLGLPAVTWIDGRIVVIPPEQIVVDENLLKQNGKTYVVD